MRHPQNTEKGAEIMAVSEAQKKSAKKWDAANLDRVPQNGDAADKGIKGKGERSPQHQRQQIEPKGKPAHMDVIHAAFDR